MKPLLLLILDGLALNPNPEANALHAARTPNIDNLLKTCPKTTLFTDGERVGLPEGQMGNSEVGHLNIGGGRVVMQELSRINKSIHDGSISANPALNKLIETANAQPTRALHIFGLVSSGGVHSSLKHLEALVREASQKHVGPLYVHAITDGRDRPQTASLEELLGFATFLESLPGENRLASIVGRYYAMDRDKRWERTRLAYQLYTEGVGEHFANAEEALKTRIKGGETDEFYKPMVIGGEAACVGDGDVLLFTNFRADRMRQLVASFMGEVPSIDKALAPQASLVGTLTEYTPEFQVEVLFPPNKVKNHLGNVIADAGLKQLRLAETEKYAHVTYFFNGGVEATLAGEKRILVPSPRDVATYDRKPEMSAYEVTDKLISEIESGDCDVMIVNYANCDMVGHTGVFEATVKAVETVDDCLGRVLEAVKKKGGTAIITADHGNADQMKDYETGEPHTFHTKHPVPFIFFGSGKPQLRPDGALCDIAPTILKLLGLEQPVEMSGSPLF